jgi:hypothetical protein
MGDRKYLNRKVLVIGHGGHGKDKFADVWRDLDVPCIGSSEAACEPAVFPFLGPRYNYKTPDDCYLDRRTHRPEWCGLIKHFNAVNPGRLAEIIFQEADVYVGMRAFKEFATVIRRWEPLVVWVDRSDHKPPEPADSMELAAADAHVQIDNNGSLDHLWTQARHLLWMLMADRRAAQRSMR